MAEAPTTLQAQPLVAVPIQDAGELARLARHQAKSLRDAPPQCCGMSAEGHNRKAQTLDAIAARLDAAITAAQAPPEAPPEPCGDDCRIEAPREA